MLKNPSSAKDAGNKVNFQMKTPTHPFYKRLKRHVIGRTRRYFIVSPPGFEALCRQELLSLALTDPQASVIPGGVEYKGRLYDCYRANLFLRSAGRILMRIHQFKATNFRQLEKNVVGIPWELYLPPKPQPDMHTTTQHCRLHHTDALGEYLMAGINQRLSDARFEDNNTFHFSHRQKILIRGRDDRFTVSIDSSGEHLYKRGLKRHPGKAPLRETIAAAALLLAGYAGTEPLIDPMCGTGTFSLEAALIAKNIPPGWFREFAFMGWPSFRQSQWESLKLRSEEKIRPPQTPLIFASDKDPFACDRLKECISKFGLEDAVQVLNQDFFDISPRQLSGQKGMVAINPPHGHRMGTRQESVALLQAIFTKLAQQYRGWKLAIIVPGPKAGINIPFNLKAYPLSHGGLKLALLVGKIF
jgi:putative N6-adenine-specific DNA methylase